MFIVFGIVMLAIYGLLVFYVSRSSWKWMQPKTSLRFRIAYIALIVICSTAFLLGRIGGGILFLQIIGSYWLAAFCLLLLTVPLLHLALWLSGLFKFPRHYGEKAAGIILLAVLVAGLSFGSYNAYSPVVREYSIHINKPNPLAQEMKIVMAADMHFGLLSGKRHAEQLVERINALQPDLVLFPGDIIDDDLRPYLDKGLAEILGQIQSKYGVYASLGNHDRHPGKMEELIAALEQGNMTVLYDDAVTIEDSLILIGRKDKIDPARAELPDLVDGLDASKPLLLLDHQPYGLGIAAENGIDMMVSGHTHRGQIAPAHLITGLLYENDWGYLQKGQMHSIVTSGYGFWGPPIRIGSRSEIVLIHVSFSG